MTYFEPIILRGLQAAAVLVAATALTAATGEGVFLWLGAPLSLWVIVR